MNSIIMKKIALTLFFVFLLIKVFADYTGTINISLSDVSYQKKNSFDLVSIKDYTFMQNPGAPHLPQKLLLFIIPTDKRVSNVVINNYSEVELPGSVNIFPAQESQVGAAPPIGFTQPDPGIYQSNSFYPIDTFKSDYTSSILGAKIYHLYFNPIKYNPVTGRVILITSITYTLVYENDPVQFQQPSVVYTKDFFENQSLLMNLIENQDEILTKYTPNVSATFARNLQANTIPIQNEIVPYIIITNNNLQDNFQDLANYLTSTGLPTIVYAVDGPNSIINSIPCLDEVCNDNQQKIRNLIKTLWSNNGLKYVLLGGDADVVPCRRAVISHFDNTSIYNALLYVLYILFNRLNIRDLREN